MNKSIVFVVMSLVSGTACAQSGTLLRIDGEAAGLGGRTMYLDGASAGVVGDTISVDSVPHEVSIDLPEGIRDILEIRTDKNSERLEARSVPNEACAGPADWYVTSDPAIHLSTEDGVAVLHLNRTTARYVGPCALELPNLQCFDKYAHVTVNSIPEVGAEIWFDGVAIGRNTSSAVDVRYCEGAQPDISVLVRKPGYVNCMTRLQLAAAGNTVNSGSGARTKEGNAGGSGDDIASASTITCAMRAVPEAVSTNVTPRIGHIIPTDERKSPRESGPSVWHSMSSGTAAN